MLIQKGNFAAGFWWNLKFLVIAIACLRLDVKEEIKSS